MQIKMNRGQISERAHVVELMIEPDILHGKLDEQRSLEGISKIHIITHLHSKTSEEVESSQSDEQHLVTHIREVVQLKKLANDRRRKQHQPDGQGEEDDQ